MPSTEALLPALRRALVARERGRINEIVAELLARRAPLGRQWQTLTGVMLHNGELHLARAVAEALVRDSGGAPAARFVQASVCARSGDLAGARAVLKGLATTAPDRLGYLYTLGMVELNSGDVAAARVLLEEAVTVQPRSGQAWLALAMAEGTRDSGLAERLLRAETGMAAAHAIEQAQYYYALGKLHDERGDVDAAFAAFARGAAAARTLASYDRRTDAVSARDAIDGYTPVMLADVQAQIGVETARPIVVTGSPRSGTTLVEQILASHSEVAGGGELGRFALVGGDLGGFSAATLERWTAAGKPAEALTKLYLHLLEEQFGRDGRVVDKTLDASRYLAAFAALLPNAPLIWLRRDPLDRAWSCFRYYFAQGVPWSYDLGDIGFHFRLEDRLLDGLRAFLGERLLVLDYETLVTEPDATIRKLVGHCGLTVEPQVFEPHKAARAVTTTSVLQVRQPINRKGIGAAERYRRHLQPFLDAYTG